MSSIRISAEDLHTNEYLEYSQTKQSLSEPLILENHSSYHIVFKIKTNQKNAICLYRSHGFLPPHKKVELPVKLLQSPSKQLPLKLEINFAQVAEEEFDQGDSKKIASVKKDFFRKILNIYPQSSSNKDDFVNPNGDFNTKIQQTSKNEESKHLESFSVNEEQPVNPFATHFATLFNSKVTQNSIEEKKEEVKPQNSFRPTISVIRSCKRVENSSQNQIKLERTPQNSRDNFVSILQETDQTKVQALKKTQRRSSSTKNLFEQLLKGPRGSSQDLFKSAKSESFDIRIKEEVKNESRTSFQGIQQRDNNSSRKIIIQKKNQQNQAFKRQLDNLQQKIHLYWEFNNDLQTIKIKQGKKYSILVFLIVSVISFALGGFIKHYQY